MTRHASFSQNVATPDPQLDRWLRNAVFAGLALSLLLPWRSEWLGFTPLWLLGMPLSAWWALHRFRLPVRQEPVPARRRRPGGQARRRRKPLAAKRFARAA
ncbi:membrane protein [Pseudoxanthomonas sangjuensis]|uniref:hypothetical protein n=1 Tax=Pseudoxanthomonas sangjuensis TaxID=1503750 RepID=UPI00139198F6|nr:hypothetical protein [Pseudoxanthomonas sangjuensis]KAF1707117.1 hypothetical protein CSC71_13405 [Pseudoxanthomonas sangjuensis]